MPVIDRPWPAPMPFSGRSKKSGRWSLASLQVSEPPFSWALAEDLVVVFEIHNDYQYYQWCFILKGIICIAWSLLSLLKYMCRDLLLLEVLPVECLIQASGTSLDTAFGSGQNRSCDVAIMFATTKRIQQNFLKTQPNSTGAIPSKPNNVSCLLDFTCKMIDEPRVLLLVIRHSVGDSTLTGRGE